MAGSQGWRVPLSFFTFFKDFFFFNMDHFKRKSCIEFATVSLLFYVLVFWLQGMWILGPPHPGIKPTPPALESPNHWDRSWVYFGRNNAKAEIPVLWPPHVKSWLIGKDSDAGRGWGQEEKGTTEDEMAGWHHGLNGPEVEWTPGIGDGQGVLACCNSWGHKESDMTERLNWTEPLGHQGYPLLSFCGQSFLETLQKISPKVLAQAEFQ